jgi:hypothetical protein
MALDDFFNYLKANTPAESKIPQTELASQLWNGFNNNPDNQKTVDAMKGMAGVIPGGVGDLASGLLAADDLRRGDYLSAGLNGVGVLPFVPSLAGLLMKTKPVKGSIDDALRASAMDAADMERGYWRGGKTPIDGKRTGNWYTQNKNEAEGFAKPDLREYAIPKSGYLVADKGYSPKLAYDVADIITDKYYGESGNRLAKELRSFGNDEGITGGQIWQSLEAHFGNDGAMDILDKLKSFSGVKGITAPGEVVVFKSAPVKDANAAKFDPERLYVDDIYGHATIPAMAATGGVGLLGAAAAHTYQNYQGKKQSPRR